MEQYQVEESMIIDEFAVKCLLGEGQYAEVKLCEKNGMYFAAKKFNLDIENGVLQRQLNFLSILKHPNIIKAVDVRPAGICKNNKGLKETAKILVLEYAEKGDLFNVIAEKGALPEIICRTYFRFLISALKYIHGQDICHLDMKPENILLDKEYNLKIADFGCATSTTAGKIDRREGTEEYMAPEILSGSAYDGKKADLFSTGMVLFMMFSGNLPWRRASASKDQLFGTMASKLYNLFWGRHSKNRPAGYFSDSFKDLINKLLAANPEERPTIQNIEQHPWFLGQILEIQDVAQIMKNLMQTEN